jgi:rubrerythrin
MESMEAFLAHAIAIEVEAAERYGELAEQMRAHKNEACAALFGRLADLEHKHAERLKRDTSGRTLPKIEPWDYQWEGAEAPETISLGGNHYLMTPRQALELALINEERAQSFFVGVSKRALKFDVQALAKQYAEEERTHVALISKWLESLPKPPQDWARDLATPIELD